MSNFLKKNFSNKKRTATEEPEVVTKKVRQSDEPAPKNKKWMNRTRILVLASRGVSLRDRHLMNDLLSLMPHAKQENKKADKKDLSILNEMAEVKNCQQTIYLEKRKRLDLYMWLAVNNKGPSVKFLVENIHTMKELKLTGNCLKGSRPLLSFDSHFEQPHWHLIKELLIKTFSTPNSHPKSQPFYDHVFTFAVIEDKIWFRNYQIVEESGELSEIGPRFVLNPIIILEQSFSGAALWTNEKYQTPTSVRRMLRNMNSDKHIARVSSKVSRDNIIENAPEPIADPTHEVFEKDLGVQFEVPSKKRKVK